MAFWLKALIRNIIASMNNLYHAYLKLGIKKPHEVPNEKYRQGKSSL